MSTIYEALLRIEKLFNCKTMIDTSELLGMPKNTFYDNKKKAKIDYENSLKVEKETNPIKKDILKKSIEQSKQKNYSNALYHAFVLLAMKNKLNLNWVFHGILPIYLEDKNKIPKVVSQDLLQDYIGNYELSIPFYDMSNEKEKKFIVLPNMVKGKNLYAIKQKDDSMAPNIKKESIVFIDTSKKKIKKAHVFFVKIGSEYLLKRLEKLEDSILLRSDNISYNTITVNDEDIEIIGQAVNSIALENIE